MEKRKQKYGPVKVLKKNCRIHDKLYEKGYKYETKFG
jgi:hypothetical protein